VEIELPPIASLSCGWAHALALTRDGTLYGWGYNADSQAGSCEGLYIERPAVIPTPEVLVSISCGSNHNLAIAQNGNLYSWAGNQTSQLGLGDNGMKKMNTPVFVQGGASEAATSSWSLILTKEGTLASCGSTMQGQLGLDLPDNKREISVFTEIPEVGNIIGFGCGYHFGYAITNLGKFMMWGNVGHFSSKTPVEFPVSGMKIPPELVMKGWTSLIWLFLGKKDSESSFFEVPEEVFYHLIGVIFPFEV
jgi:alpha-tubulin suppressor-like RCC1 family protein